MNKTFKHFAKAMIVAAAFSIPSVSLAYKSVAVDRNGNTIKDSRGNCVLTKWEAYRDVCAMSKCPDHKAHKPSKKPVTAVSTPKKGEVYNLNKESKTIYFGFNSDKLSSQSTAKLDKLIDIIKGSKEVSSVEIIGYTDKIGSAKYNKALSDRRAKAVQDYFTSRGYLKTSTVNVLGLGASNFVSSCDKDMDKKALISCSKKDRRVETKIRFYN